MSISRFISTAASGQDFYVKTWHSKTNTKSNVDSSSCSHFASEIRPPLEKAEVEVIKVMQGVQMEEEDIISPQESGHICFSNAESSVC